MTISIFRTLRMTSRIGIVTVSVTMLAACGGGRGASVLPMPARAAAPGTVALRLTIPAPATLSAFRKPAYISPATNSLTFSQNGGATQTIALTPSSPACTAVSGVRTCIVLLSATAGVSQSFALALFASTDGSGPPLARRTIVVDVVSGRENPVTATLDGVVAGVTLRFTPAALQYGEPAQTGSVVVNALDAAGQVIVGPGVFVDATGNPVTIALSNGDTTGSTALAPASITQSTTVALSYNGGAVTAAKIDATASNGPSATATLPIVCASPGTTPNLYIADEAGYGLAPLNESGFYGTSLELPLAHRVTTRADGPLAVDSRGFVYVLSSTADRKRSFVLQFCPSAYGVATPFRSSVSTLAQQLNMTVGTAGDVFTVGYVPDNAIYRFAPDAGQIGPPGSTPAGVAARIAGPHTQLFGPTGLAVDATGTVYAGNAGQVTAYAPGANGDVSPSRTIANTAGGLLLLADAHIDAAGNVYALYNRNNRNAQDPAQPFGPPAVVEYLHGVFGVPVRVISGPNTQLGTIAGNGFAGGYPQRIAIDLAGNIYVLNAVQSGDSITVYESVSKYSPAANGDVAPVASFNVNTVGGLGGGFAHALAISPGGNVAVSQYGDGIWIYTNSGVQLAHIPTSATLGVVNDLAYDSAGNLAVLSARSVNGTGMNALLTYAPNPTDNSTPATVNPVPGAQYYNRIVYDAAGTLHATGVVVDGGAVVDTFSPGSTSGVPSQRFVPSGDYTAAMTGLGYDAAGNPYVASPFADAVFAYPAGSSGTAQPTGAYSDYRPSTLNAEAVATDAAGNVYVADCKLPASVSVYPPGTNGVPSRAIIGQNTGLYCPTALAVDADGSLYVESSKVYYYHKIAMFAPGASGDVAPTLTVTVEDLGEHRNLPTFAVGPAFATFSSASGRAALTALAARSRAGSSKLRPSVKAPACAPQANPSRGPSVVPLAAWPCGR